MSETPEALRALIDQASQAGPGPERLARVRARLESQIGPLDAPRASPTGAGPTALGPTTLLGPKTLSTIAVLAVIGIALWLGTRSPAPEPMMEPVRTPSPPTDIALAPDVEPPRALEPQGVEPLAAETDGDEPTVSPLAVSPPPVSPRARPSTRETIDPPPVLDSASSLREEIALLDRALRASEAGDVAHARQALDEHRARFPSGTLSPERDRMLAELAPEP